MPTIAQINKLAFDGVQAAIPDAIISATLSEEVKSTTYSTTEHGFPIVNTSRGSCRAVVETTRPITDLFPDYIAGSHDILIYLEGYTTPPEEGWKITMQGKVRTIKRAQDLLLAGSAGYVVAI